MRQFVVRTLSAVLFLLVLCSQSSLLAQSSEAKKTSQSSGKTAKEKTLKADDGGLVKVERPLSKERRSQGTSGSQDQGNAKPVEAPAFRVMTHPREERLTRGRAFHGDLRTLPQIPPEKFERPEFEEPKVTPVPLPGTSAAPSTTAPGTASAPAPAPAAPAPTPSASFDGLDFATWGAGHPPDTNGDVGPTYYIQTINTSIGIFRKSDGVRVAAFTFNTFFNGHFGNLCDTNNFGDPVVVYDTFEDRWIITDFAFVLSGGNPAAPVFQCFAVSKSGDPVNGGWNFYSIKTAATAADAFDDYPKFGIWPDGLYMSANMFAITGGSFQNVRVWAFNKAQMYAGSATVQIVNFDAPAGEFTMLPSNARLQAGTPPTGTPNYFATVFNFTNAVSTYKFHVDWNNTANSTFTGPLITIAPTSWANAPGNVVTPSPGTNIDTLAPRLMVQNQYTNIGGAESVWLSHTVRGTAATNAAPRYYQFDVTGGTVAANTTQAFTHNPDSSALNRFMPSLAVDRAGDMAIGYTAASSTVNPALRYAGRLAGDSLNSLPQTETSLFEGTGTQQTASFTRWGDYSAMSLDPNGCTFWYTNMYYAVNGVNFLTRIGAFAFPSCTPVGSGGAVSGIVTAAVGGNPISGATVALGSRTTTTAVDGTYSFSSLPAGTYPSITASSPGYVSSTATAIVVNDGSTTTQDFSLTLAPTSGCFVDTAQADFQAGTSTNCDLVTSPGNVTLSNASTINQQNTTLGNNGVGITITTWGGQTFTPSVTGLLTEVDVNLFCSGCTGTTPDLTLSIRATSGGLPTGADLVAANVTGFNSGAAGFHTATFGSPITLTAGTQYALVIRPTTNPSPGTYALTRSGTATAGADVYAGGTRVSGATSGTVWSIPLTGGVSTDAGFKVFINTGFASTGTFTSSLKDANPAADASAHWTTLSWTASTPLNTSIKFQAAASNNASGPFNFVGPDGTTGTFFNSGDSLAQFNSFRYLKYQATLSTTDSTQTPVLNDVTTCFNDVHIVSAPSITKQFGALSIPLNGTTSLTFNITNNDGTSGLTGLAFTDSLPAGLVVASTPNLSNSCGGTATAVGGASSVSLSGGTLAASASCTVSVDVQGTTAGLKNNSVQVTSTEGGTGNTSNASITVVGPPVIIKAFGAASIPLNGSTSLTFTIQNNNTTQALSGVAFSDTLPAGLVISTPNGLTGSCGAGTITATQNTNVISLSGGTIATSSSCTFAVNVKGTTAGQKNNTTGNVTSTEGGTGGTASASVKVEAPPSIAKVFNPNAIALNATTSLTFTITNPAANVDALTGVAFTDTLPTGLTVANASATVCGGTLTTTAPTGISLSGATIAASAQCQFSVTVTGAAVGDYTNTTGNVTSTNGGTGNTASASLLVVGPPSIAKAFGAASIPLNGTTSLTFTINNPNTATPASAIAFTDNLPAGLVVATPSNLTSNCSGAPGTIAVGPSLVTASGLVLGPSSSCTLSVDVQGTTPGLKNNSVQVTSNLGTGNTSNASIAVGGPPVIIKAFGAASIPLNGSTSLTFTIQNNNNTQALSGVAFSDTLPAGLVISTPNGLTGSCGAGTITATQNTNVISLSGGTIASSSSCTFAVNVTGTAAGLQNNTTGNVTSTEGGTGGTASASVKVEAPPSIAKVFNPSTISLNATTSLTFTITNPAANVDALTGVAFTDTLPTGLTVANASATVCGGTLTTTAPTGIALSGATININNQCQFSVTVTGAASGAYTNTTGNVTSTNGGTGNTASANLAVASPPTITKAFGAPQIPLNGTTSLTLSINNPNTTIALSGVAFTDNLPAGLVVASTPNLSNTCGGTATAVGGASSVSLSGGTLAASASCAVSVDVQGTTAGGKNNSVQVTSTEGGTGNTSNASVTVVAPPVIIKAFGAASIPLNGATSLTFTIQNNNTTVGLTGVGFSDTLPAGLIISTPNGLAGSCGGGTITATQNTNVISLSGGTIASSSSCTFAVNVTGTAAGLQNNTTGNVTSTEGGTGGTASASVKVEAPPSIAKVFNPSTIGLNATTSLTFTITNPAANVDPLTGVAFTDTLPTGLTVANASATICGGTVTTTAPTGISLTGATIAANNQCQFSVTVTGAATGQYTNTTGSVSSTNGGTGNTASANLTVASAPTITKAFGAASILVNATTSLTFSISNPNTALALTGVAFTDNLPAGLIVATPNGVSTTCNGTVTATAGSGSIIQSGGTLAANGSCTITVNVQGAQAGVQNNTTGPISSTQSGAGATSNTASITVIGPPSIAKAFGAAGVALNGTTTLSFTITNANATVALTGAAFGDTLPAGLAIATPNGLTGSCGAGTITTGTVSGFSVVNLSGGTIAAGGSCTFAVNVVGQTSGHKVNTTGTVTSSNAGSGNQATASVDVEGPPSIAKAFNPTVIAVNGTSALTLTITNPASNPLDLAGVAVTDNLPAGLVVATPNGLTNTCGGTATATAGSGSVSLTGGSVTVNSSCTLTVNVTAPATGNFVNTTGAVSSTNGGTGNTASATLNALVADLTITKTHTDPFSRGQTGATYTITVKNSGAGPTIGTVTVVDTLPNVANPLVATAMSGTGWTCTLGTLTCTRSDALASGASYPAITLTVNVPSNIKANVANTATVSGGGETNTGNDTANDPTHIGPPIQITPANGTATITAGQAANFGLTLESSPGMGAVTFTCSGLPAAAGCTFNPPSSSQLSDTINMNITTTARSTSSSSLPRLPGGPTYALLFSALGLAGIVITGKKSKKMRLRVVMAVSGMALLLALAGCGGRPKFNGANGTPAGAYTITVTGTSGGTSGSATVTLNVQ